MSALLVGYARVLTQDQDLTAQRDALAALGVAVKRNYVDHGLTGTNRDRPGLRRRWRRVAAATRWSSRSSTASRGRCPTRAISSRISRRVRSSSVSAGRCTTPPIPSGGCCSTSWRWSRSLSLTSSDCARRKGCASRRPKGTCVVGRRSSTRARKRTWSCCTAAASTAPPSSATCSASGARRCTE